MELANVKNKLNVLKDTRATELASLTALEEILKVEKGLSADAVHHVLLSLKDIKKLDVRIKLLRGCLPSGTVPDATIDCVVYLLTKASTVISEKKALLEWLLVGVQYFFSGDNCARLHCYYTHIFLQTYYETLLPVACAVLELLTDSSDVAAFRVHDLLRLSSPERFGHVGNLWTLIEKYRQFQPTLVQYVSPATTISARGTRSKMLDETLERWLAARRSTAGPPTAVGPATAGHNGTTSSSLSAMWSAAALRAGEHGHALAQLPLPLPASFEQRQAGLRPLTAVSSVRQAIDCHAFGLRVVGLLSSLLLNRDRRSLLLLTGRLDMRLAQASLELVPQLRRMFGDSTWHEYIHVERQHAMRQLALAARVHLPITGLPKLFKLVLTSAAPKNYEVWLPLLEMLPFLGWTPYQQLQSDILWPLRKLVRKCTRHVRLRVIQCLQDLVLRLAKVDLPKIQHGLYPYNTPALKQVPRQDAAVELGRQAEAIFGDCAKMCEIFPPCNHLLSATFDFCRRVTPALLDAGVPIMPHIPRELFFKTLCSTSPYSLNKMLLYFSQYPEYRDRITDMHRSVLVSVVASATLDAMEQDQFCINDIVRLCFGVQRGVLAPDLDEDTKKALVALGDGLYLCNHVALVSFSSQLRRRRRRPLSGARARLDELVDLLSDHQLHGFRRFRDAYVWTAQ